MDSIDRIMAQWAKQSPDLDVEPMALIGRLQRVSKALTREMEATFARHGLTGPSFDVLATLLRSGVPHALSPNELLETMMITSGTLTNRIDQLEKSGFVTRAGNKQDKRSVIVSLTRKGLAIIDKAVTAHVETQTRLTGGLTPAEHKLLNQLLQRFLSTLPED